MSEPIRFNAYAFDDQGVVERSLFDGDDWGETYAKQIAAILTASGMKLRKGEPFVVELRHDHDCVRPWGGRECTCRRPPDLYVLARGRWIEVDRV